MAFCPSPPLLVPELASRAAGELDRLRATCDRAVAEMVKSVGDKATVLVLAAGSDASQHDGSAGGSFRPWGVDVQTGGPGEPVLGLGLALGAWLLDRADLPLERRLYQCVSGESPTPADPAVDREHVLLVMGDGASTRTPKAPGSFRPESEPYDAAVRQALAGGDPEQLVALDNPTAVVVGASGARAWATAAAWWGSEPASHAWAENHGAPYGVGYFVGAWRR